MFLTPGSDTHQINQTLRLIQSEYKNLFAQLSSTQPSVAQTQGAFSAGSSAASTVSGVTSVGLSLPAQFSVAGSPVTSAGTLVVSWNPQTANTVFAGPTTGAAAVPAFRALVNADLPLTGVAANTYGDATHVGIFTVNTAGVLTSASTSATALTPQSRLVSTGTGLSGGGDLTADRTLSITNTTVAAASYGDATHVGTFTVNAQGQLTAASNVLITGTTPGGAAGGDLAGTYPNPTVANLSSGVTLAATILATNVAAPSTPAAGKTQIYVDSTQKVLSAKNDAGTVSITVVPSSAGAHQFATALSSAGVITWTQPAFSDLSGSATAAQMPAFSGDISTSAGSTVTTLVSVLTAGGPTGDATHVPTITWDAKGRLLSVSSTAITYPGSFSGFANPTASVGLTAVNGAATTAMRSDAAPALDVSISPTWSGSHIFSLSTRFTSTIGVVNAAPSLNNGILVGNGNSIPGTGTSQTGISVSVLPSSSATTSFVGVNITAASAVASYTQATAEGIRINTPNIGAGSTVTTVYAIRISAQTGGGTNYSLFTAGAGLVLIQDTTAATSTSAAAVVITGGIGVGGAGYLGGLVSCKGRIDAIVKKTGTYTVTANDLTVEGDATTAAFTISLPSAPTTGELHKFIKTDSSANAVTISGNGKNINGASTSALSTQYSKLTVQYDGTIWVVLA